MGAVNVSRHADGQLTPAQLKDWYKDELYEMAREGGTDAYCGNWNSNDGLHIVNGTFTLEQAKAYCDKNLDKRGSVLAFRIGDFSKVWPVTKAQQDILDRVTKLDKEVNEFDYRILERAQGQKSKTKKCAHCESAINVHKISKPSLKDLNRSDSHHVDVGLFFQRGRYFMSSYYGMTDCPVCCQNLLKTETDIKNQASLVKRQAEARKKEQESRAAYAKAQAGKPAPFWYVEGCCGC
jgi:hypothetical protein